MYINILFCPLCYSFLIFINLDKQFLCDDLKTPSWRTNSGTIHLALVVVRLFQDLFDKKEHEGILTIRSNYVLCNYLATILYFNIYFEMGCCTGRCFLIVLCILQLISTVERLVFDFLGYMWAPIIGNFLEIIFVIIGLFGALQYRPKIVIVYCVWSLIWLAWNVFVICFYLEVGVLNRDNPYLNIGTGNKSWWLNNGIGCVVNGNQSENATPGLRYIPPEESVTGCLLPYYYVEVIHAGVQCLLGLIGFCVACFVIYVFTEEDDSSFWETQPVHDELEYIKMRYRSPARISFRDNRTYETQTSQMSTYSSNVPLYNDGQTAPPQTDIPWTNPAHTEDYGFNTSSQLLKNAPGQTII